MELVETLRKKLKHIPDFPRKIDWQRYAESEEVFIPFCVCIHEFDGSWTAFSGVPEVVKPQYAQDFASYQRRDKRIGEHDREGIMNSDALYEKDARLLFPEYAHLNYYSM